MTHLKEAITYLSDLVEKVLSETISQVDFEDLTQQQLHCMRVILRLHNPNITELAAELKLTKPTVTVLVDKLVSKGYIRRVPSDKDRRSTHLHIDEKGKKIEQLRDIAHQRMAEQISSGLSETETAILTELLKKIVWSS